MASNQNPSEVTSIAQTIITQPDAFGTRPDTLSDADRTDCRTDCETTWQTNWYQQQADLLTGKWVSCEAEADKKLNDQLDYCRKYTTGIYSGICMQQAFMISETYRTTCVYDAIQQNAGLKSPTDYATTKKLSWYDGRGVCLNYIALNAKSKSDTCKGKNCQ